MSSVSDGAKRGRCVVYGGDRLPLGDVGANDGLLDWMAARESLTRGLLPVKGLYEGAQLYKVRIKLYEWRVCSNAPIQSSAWTSF